MFVSSALQKEVAMQAIGGNELTDSIENIATNLTNITPEQKAVIQEIVGEEVIEFSEALGQDFEEDPMGVVLGIFKNLGLVLLVSSLIEVGLLYIAVCYVLSFSIKGKAYDVELT